VRGDAVRVEGMCAPWAAVLDTEGCGAVEAKV
jgi:hypothetical protein